MVNTITVDNVEELARSSAYGPTHQYRGVAIDLFRLVAKARTKKMLADQLAKLNERRRSSHPLHHHYETDLAKAGAMVEAARCAGVIQ